MIETVKSVSQLIGVCCHNQWSILLGGLLNNCRKAGDHIYQLYFMVAESVIITCRSWYAASFLEDTIGTHICILNIRASTSVKTQGFIDIEDDVFIIVHRKHGISQSA